MSMSIRHGPRKAIAMGVLAVVLPLASVTFLGAQAGATPKPPPFNGAAVGKVSCDLPKIKVRFDPPLTFDSWWPTYVTFKGTLKDCTVSGPGPYPSVDVITLGKIEGYFTLHGAGSYGGTCLALLNGTDTPVNFTVQWKGKHGGAKATYSDSTVNMEGVGPAVNPVTQGVGWELPNPATPLGYVEPGGSFFGVGGVDVHESFGYSTVTQAQIKAVCATRPGPHGTQKRAKGLKKLTLTSGEFVLPPYD